MTIKHAEVEDESVYFDDLYQLDGRPVRNVAQDKKHPRHKFRTLGRVTRDPKYSPESFLLREPARSALRGTVYLIRQAVKQSTEWVR